MSTLIRWALVLVVLYYGIRGTIDWSNPVVVPTSEAISDRSVSRVDLVWESAIVTGSNPGQEEIVRDVLPERPVEEPERPPPIAPDFPSANQRVKSFVYSVQPGDTLGEIAQRFLGSVQAGTREIRANNPGIPENGMIRVGQELVIPAILPPDTQLDTSDRREDSNPRQFYVVQEGDTLSAITQRYFGHGDFNRILKANRDILPNPDQLKPGMRLKIPND